MKFKVLIIIALALIVSGSYAQISGNILKVKGEAVMYQVPELMMVSIPIQSKSNSYEECSDQLFKIFNSLKKELIKSGIEEKFINSDRLRIHENFQWIEREKKSDGYIGSINVTIELEHKPEVLKNIINVLKDDQFKFGYALSFKLSRKQVNELQEKAIRAAIEDATNKAKIIAESLNIELLEIKEVNYGYISGGRDLLVVENDVEIKMAGSAKSDIDLNPQEMQIRKTIGVIWEIEQ